MLLTRSLATAALLAFAPLASLAAAACGDDGGGLPAHDGLLRPPPEGQGVQLNLKVRVEPGQETTFCQFYAAPPGGIDVAKFEHAYTPVSHHIIVYLSSMPAEQRPVGITENCNDDPAISDTIIGLAYGSQEPSESRAFPDDIAMPVVATTMYIEYHVLNTTDAAVDAEAAVNLWAHAGGFTGAAGTLFFYHDLIAIPPGATATARRRCPIADDVTLMLAIPHLHARGTAFRADLVGGAGAPITLINSLGWEGNTVLFAPEIEAKAGQLVDYSCDYANTTAELIVEGSSATKNEMCVFAATYYRRGKPRLDFQDEFCFDEDTIVYTGATDCAATVACSQAVSWVDPVGGAAQYELCRTQACEGAGQAHAAYVTCLYEGCAAECFAAEAGNPKLSDMACATCNTTKCAALGESCAAATCP